MFLSVFRCLKEKEVFLESFEYKVPIYGEKLELGLSTPHLGLSTTAIKRKDIRSERINACTQKKLAKA